MMNGKGNAILGIMTAFSIDLEKNLVIVGIFLLLCPPPVLYACCSHQKVQEDLHYKECDEIPI